MTSASDVEPASGTTDRGVAPHETLAAGFVELRVDGPRADVALNRPDVRNAQTPATWRALASVPSLLPDEVRVVVLRGEGRSFSAGLDRRMFDPAGVPGEGSLVSLAARPAEEIDSTIAHYQQAFSWWRGHDAVTIAAVQGHAVGAGFQLALACDLVVCADDAQFIMREPSLGLVPDLGGTGPLVDVVGYPRALEICATGRAVHAAEAVSLGIAQAAVPTESLAAAVDDLVAALLAPPAGAVVATKRLLRDAPGRSRAEQMAAERAEQVGRLAGLRGLLG